VEGCIQHRRFAPWFAVLAFVAFTRVTPAMDYRFDVALGSSSSDNKTWFQLTHLPALSFPSVNGHAILQSTLNQTYQNTITSSGNSLGIYYNDFHLRFPNDSAATTVTKINDFATSRFGAGANQRWINLNEIDAATWNGSSGSAYRTWLVDTMKGLHDAGYNNIILWSPRYLASKTYQSTFQTIAQYANIGLETYQDGRTIKNNNFSLSKTQAYYQNYFDQWTSTTSGAGVDKSKIFAGEHFSVNLYDPTYYWGANGTSGTDWQKAIEIRNIAIHNIAFGGFIGYFWQRNDQATGDDAIDLAAQLSYERAYASTLVVQSEVPTWTGNSGADLSWSNYLNWTGGLPSTTQHPFPLLASTNPDLPKQTTANLYNTIRVDTTVTLDGNQSVTTLGFDSPYHYTIAPGTGGSLTITGSGAAINVLSGLHTITAPLAIASSTSANITGNLTVANGFSNSGVTFTKTGAGSLTISGPQSNTPNSIFNANAGVTNFNSNVGGNLNLNANSTVNFGSAQNLRSLTIASGKVVTAQPGGANTVRVGSWSITGKLDLNDNSAIFDYGSTSPIDSIRQLIQTGYNNGSWNGNGIMSTLAQSSSVKTAIGFAEASALFSTFPATYAGQTIDSTTILLRYTVPGDATMDGKTDILDFNQLASNFGKAGMTWRQGDFNYDGAVNISDFNLLAGSFGKSVPSTQPPGAILIRANENPAIPLPPAGYAGAVGLVLAAIFASLGRRRLS
jgi:hypothetical protein